MRRAGREEDAADGIVIDAPRIILQGILGANVQHSGKQANHRTKFASCKALLGIWMS